MHAQARAPSSIVSVPPRAPWRRRTRTPAQAESSSAKPPSRPEQVMATTAPSRSRGSRRDATALRLTDEARIKSQLLGDEERVLGFGDVGRERGRGTGDAAFRQTAMARVPFVVVQAMSLPSTAARLNSRGELPRSKPSGRTALRSPASSTSGDRCFNSRAWSSDSQGTMERAPLASAWAALVVKRRTSITTERSATVGVGRRKAWRGTREGRGGVLGFRNEGRDEERGRRDGDARSNDV